MFHWLLLCCSVMFSLVVTMFQVSMPTVVSCDVFTGCDYSACSVMFSLVVTMYQVNEPTAV